VEPESFETPEHGAGVAKQFSDKSATNFDSVSIENHRAQCSLLAPTRDGCDCSLDGGSPSKCWAKELVAGTGVGACIHFLAVFLVFECDGHMLGVVQEFRVGVQQHTPRGCAENKTPQSDSVGSS
jgi:hypothetical protein